MENASKALLMAAEVLIGLLILSLAVYLFANFGSTSAEINKKNIEQQLVQFNDQYASYLGRQDLTIYDICTIANNAKDNNQKYENQEEYSISVSITGIAGRGNLQDKTENEWNQIIQNDTMNINGSTDLLPKYKCTDIKYNTAGRVCQVIFKKIVNIY